MKRITLQKTVVFIALSLLGMIIAYPFYSDYFDLLKMLYERASNGKMEFYGKYFLFPSPIAIILFGLSFGSMLYHTIFIKRRKLFRVLLWLIIFAVSTWLLSYIDAIWTMISCTICDTTKFRFYMSTIDIVGILSSASVLSMIPSIFVFFKRK